MSAVLTTGLAAGDSHDRVVHDQAVRVVGNNSIPRFLDISVLRPVAPGPIRVAIAVTVGELCALEADWRELETAAAKSFNAFQTFDWCLSWAQTYAGTRCCSQLFVVTVRQGSELKLIWPLMRTCVGPLCVLRWLSDPYGQYGDVLAHSDNNLDTWLVAAWSAITKRAGAGAVRLRHVRADATVHDFLASRLDVAAASGIAPFLDLTRFSDEDDYSNRYTTVQRRRRRRIRYRLEQTGPLDFKQFGDGENFTGLVAQMIDVKRQWLNQRGLYSRAIMSDRLLAFITRLSQSRSSGIYPAATVLQAGDRQVSYELGLKFRGRHMGFITAHNPEFHDASPARLHMDFCQRLAIKERMKVFDLMMPADSYKSSWSNDRMEVFDFHKPLSSLGRIYTTAFLGLARPVIRHIYQITPCPLRRLAMKFTRR